MCHRSWALPANQQLVPRSSPGHQQEYPRLCCLLKHGRRYLYHQSNRPLTEARISVAGVQTSALRLSLAPRMPSNLIHRGTEGYLRGTESGWPAIAAIIPLPNSRLLMAGPVRPLIQSADSIDRGLAPFGSRALGGAPVLRVARGGARNNTGVNRRQTAHSGFGRWVYGAKLG